MKKLIFILMLVPMCLLGSNNVNGMRTDTKKIKLPAPDKRAEMTLFDALQNRASSREFTKGELDDRTLSTLLWAACGVNREDGKLTAPSAMNRQSISVYVCRADGAYLWNAPSNYLQIVSQKDLRPALLNGQPGIGPFSVGLVLVADNARFDEKAVDAPLQMVTLDAAFVSQNINLACTALSLSNVPRINMDQTVLRKELQLTPTQFPILNNLVGHK